jgi:hypothetical protein
MNKLRYLPLLLVIVLPAGCAKGLNYRVLNRHLGSGRCELATRYVEESRKDYLSNSRLLYMLDAGQVNLYCGRHGESNRHFQSAEELADDLWTKSITREAAAFLVSDYTTAYSGEDFERALIDLFSAVNYAALGELEDALVECRQLDVKLTEYNDKYDEKNVYKEDAFGRYLSGIIYEATGGMDDAYIDYFRAYKTYQDYYGDYGTPVPSLLVEDLVRAAEATGRMEEVREELGRRRPEGISHEKARGLGRIVLVHLNGRAPEKAEDRVVIPTPRGPITMSFPRFVVRPPGCRYSELVAVSAFERASERTELVEDINRIAVKNLEDRKARVVAKTLARAVVKQAAIEGAARQFDDERLRQLTRFGLNIVNLAIEKADTRSWKTLPGEIYLTRVFVPEGRYDLRARLCYGHEVPLQTVEIKAGETKFVLLNTRA